MEWEGPAKQGLYDPQNEHEACGVGFVVAIDGKRTHKVSIPCIAIEIHLIILLSKAAPALANARVQSIS